MVERHRVNNVRRDAIVREIFAGQLAEGGG
jgi:hypothetical protein